jgi:hypothetical protein
MLKRMARPMLIVLALLGGTVATTAVTASPAAALCVANPLEGDWHNVNTSTPAMTRILIETCQPVTTCSGGVCSTTFDAGTFTTPFGKCQPTDCGWGRLQAQYMTDGWIRTIYNFGFKTSYVWARNYTYYGLTYLRLYVSNDFTAADGRTDYVTDEWLLK